MPRVSRLAALLFWTVLTAPSQVDGLASRKSGQESLEPDRTKREKFADPSSGSLHEAANETDSVDASASDNEFSMLSTSRKQNIWDYEENLSEDFDESNSLVGTNSRQLLGWGGCCHIHVKQPHFHKPHFHWPHSHSIPGFGDAFEALGEEADRLIGFVKDGAEIVYTTIGDDLTYSAIPAEITGYTNVPVPNIPVDYFVDPPLDDVDPSKVVMTTVDAAGKAVTATLNPSKLVRLAKDIGNEFMNLFKCVFPDLSCPASLFLEALSSVSSCLGGRDCTIVIGGCGSCLGMNKPDAAVSRAFQLPLLTDTSLDEYASLNFFTQLSAETDVELRYSINSNKIVIKYCNIKTYGTARANFTVLPSASTSKGSSFWIPLKSPITIFSTIFFVKKIPVMVKITARPVMRASYEADIDAELKASAEIQFESSLESLKFVFDPSSGEAPFVEIRDESGASWSTRDPSSGGLNIGTILNYKAQMHSDSAANFSGVVQFGIKYNVNINGLGYGIIPLVTRMAFDASLSLNSTIAGQNVLTGASSLTIGTDLQHGIVLAVPYPNSYLNDQCPDYASSMCGISVGVRLESCATGSLTEGAGFSFNGVCNEVFKRICESLVEAFIRPLKRLGELLSVLDQRLELRRVHNVHRYTPYNVAFTSSFPTALNGSVDGSSIASRILSVGKEAVDLINGYSEYERPNIPAMDAVEETRTIHRSTKVNLRADSTNCAHEYPNIARYAVDGDISTVWQPETALCPQNHNRWSITVSLNPSEVELIKYVVLRSRADRPSRLPTAYRVYTCKRQNEWDSSFSQCTLSTTCKHPPGKDASVCTVQEYASHLKVEIISTASGHPPLIAEIEAYTARFFIPNNPKFEITYLKYNAGTCAGGDMINGTFTNSSFAFCKTSCTNMRGCRGFNYVNSTKTCSLKNQRCASTTTGLEGQFYAQSDYSRVCGSCGNDGTQRSGVSLAECQRLCDETADCMGVDYRQSPQHCKLQTQSCAVGMVRNSVAQEHLDFVHYKKNTWWKRTGDCPGYDILGRSGVTLSECEDTCEDHDNCQGISYNSASRQCYIKSGTCITGLYTNGFISYHRTTPPNYLTFGADCPGNDILPRSDQMQSVSLAQCLEDCERRADCEGVSFGGGSGRGRCAPKTVGTAANCVITPSDFKYYKKSGFKIRQDCGDCDFAPEVQASNKNVGNCEVSCLGQPYCAGFSFSPETNRCKLRLGKCKGTTLFTTGTDRSFFFERPENSLGKELPTFPTPPKDEPDSNYTNLCGLCVNVPHLSTISVSLEQCKVQCDRTVNCYGIQYNTQNGLCELKAGVCDDPGDLGAGVNLGGSEIVHTFYRKNKWIMLEGDCTRHEVVGAGPTYPDLFGTTDTLDGCKRRCEADARCKGVSYNSIDLTCYGKYRSCAKPRVSNWNYYVRDAPKRYMTYPGDLPGNDFGSPNLLVLNGVTKTACILHCETLGDACVGVSYHHPSMACYPKHTLGGGTPITTNGATFYKRSQYEMKCGDCFSAPVVVDTADRHDPAYTLQSRITTLHECERLCEEDNLCAGFSYFDGICKTKLKTCSSPRKVYTAWYDFNYRYGWNASFADQSIPISHQTPSEKIPRIIANYTTMCGDCPGNDIAVYKYKTLSECQEICDTLPNCYGVSYFEQTGRCVPKNKTCDFPVNFGENVHYFYHKNFYLKRDGDCPNNDIPGLGGVRSLAQCKAVCDASSACRGISHNPLDNRCYPKNQLCTSTYKNGFYFYHKNAPPHYFLFVENHDCVGSDPYPGLPAGNILTLEQCILECEMRTASCFGVAYNADTNICKLRGINCKTGLSPAAGWAVHLNSDYGGAYGNLQCGAQKTHAIGDPTRVGYVYQLQEANSDLTGITRGNCHEQAKAYSFHSLSGLVQHSPTYSYNLGERRCIIWRDNPILPGLFRNSLLPKSASLPADPLKMRRFYTLSKSALARKPEIVSEIARVMFDPLPGVQLQAMVRISMQLEALGQIAPGMILQRQQWNSASEEWEHHPSAQYSTIVDLGTRDRNITDMLEFDGVQFDGLIQGGVYRLHTQLNIDVGFYVFVGFDGERNTSLEATEDVIQIHSSDFNASGNIRVGYKLRKHAATTVYTIDSLGDPINCLDGIAYLRPVTTPSGIPVGTYHLLSSTEMDMGVNVMVHSVKVPARPGSPPGYRPPREDPPQLTNVIIDVSDEAVHIPLVGFTLTRLIGDPTRGVYIEEGIAHVIRNVGAPVSTRPKRVAFTDVVTVPGIVSSGVYRLKPSLTSSTSAVFEVMVIVESSTPLSASNITIRTSLSSPFNIQTILKKLELINGTWKITPGSVVVNVTDIGVLNATNTRATVRDHVRFNNTLPPPGVYEMFTPRGKQVGAQVDLWYDSGNAD